MDMIFKMNKKSISFSRSEKEIVDIQYWKGKTPVERLAVLEFLRQQQDNYDSASRLQRVYQFIERK